MKLELPRCMSTSPWVELFLPITTLLCLTRYSNSFPWILAIGVFEIWLFPFTGFCGEFAGSLRAKRAHASAEVSYLTFWDIAAMLVDQCRVRPVLIVLCYGSGEPGDSWHRVTSRAEQYGLVVTTPGGTSPGTPLASWNEWRWTGAD